MGRLHVKVATGTRFTRLLVLYYDVNSKLHAPSYVCQCDCGTIVSVRGAALQRKLKGTKSCGCLKVDLSRRSIRELRQKMPTPRKTHGEASHGRRSAEYQAWLGMKRRCYDVSNKSYVDYGLRGIHVCSEWLTSFPQFLADLGRRPSSGHSLDRTDNDGNYEPNNCRWADKSEQNRNRRNFILTAARLQELLDKETQYDAYRASIGVL